MQINKISDKVSVSPQILASDMQAIADAGFRAIICNRPDGEDADQPSFDEIKRAAKAAEIEARYIPVQPSGLTDEALAAFAGALDGATSPVLAYCRSGARSAMLVSALDAQVAQMT